MAHSVCVWHCALKAAASLSYSRSSSMGVARAALRCLVGDRSCHCSRWVSQTLSLVPCDRHIQWSWRCARSGGCLAVLAHRCSIARLANQSLHRSEQVMGTLCWGGTGWQQRSDVLRAVSWIFLVVVR